MFWWKPKKWRKTDSCLGFLIPPPFYSQFSERIFNNYDKKPQKKQPKSEYSPNEIDFNSLIKVKYLDLLNLVTEIWNFPANTEICPG